MRYRVSIGIGPNDSIPKDKNRMILSFLKHTLANSDAKFFEKVYVKGEGTRKDFSFALYMKEAKFLRETIVVPEKRLFLNFSAYDMVTGIQFYNAMVKSVNKKFVYKGETQMYVERVGLIQEEIFTSDKASFKTLSPMVVREHNKSTNRDWFYSIDDEKGKSIFLENIKYQLLASIPEAAQDLDNIDINVIKNKEVKVKNYGVEVLSNLCTFNMTAKPYILEYFYKAGIGSYKSQGFGLLTVACGRG